MTERQEIARYCSKRLIELGIVDEQHKKRLMREFEEIENQGEWDYVYSTWKRFQEENLVFEYNEHNNLVDYLLGLTDCFDINSPSAYIQGECPDIDVDYIKEVRDELKDVWAAERFGRENVCAISTYSLSKLKSSVRDMARMFSKPKDEVDRVLGTMIEGDEEVDEDGGDEGDPLRSVESAKRAFPEFKNYCEKYPEVADAVEKLMGRIRAASSHAGGLIVSSKPLSSFVPLEVRKASKENPKGIVVASWTEGQNRQDLQPVGLIKIDMLVLKNLMQIALTCKLIQDRHGIDKICALPGQWNFSDTSYLNDPKVIELADKGDLKGIFQFDKNGIQAVVKRSGVSVFDDLAAISALYRPGPLSSGMDKTFCNRKRGLEEYSIHPKMQKILGPTYGVMVYQEQIMEILRVIGGIPKQHTEKIRKAISKKKIEQFIKYKNIFMENAQIRLGESKEYVENLWQQIETFSEYGFNKSHSYAYTYISARLLYLKAHYPLEFYTALLMCQTDSDKIKEYKLDAEKHNIQIMPVHINKSGINFSIKDDKIYYGFSNLGWIGESVASDIVKNQPYASFTDFVEKFGCNSTPLKALISLGVFEEKIDRVILRKYIDYYKKATNSEKARITRFEATLQKYDEKLLELVKEMIIEEDDEKYLENLNFGDECFEKIKAFCGAKTKLVSKIRKGVETFKEVPYVDLVVDLFKKRENAIKSSDDKKDLHQIQSLNEFSHWAYQLDEEEMDLLTDEVEIHGVKYYPKAEQKYYGFQWTHLIELSPDYNGSTILRFMQEVENNQLKVGSIQVKVNKINKRVSKKGLEFYNIQVEDANAQNIGVTMWSEDYERFKEELVEGNYVGIQVLPPSNGFKDLSFKSYPKHLKKFMPEKDADARLVKLRMPVVNTKKEIAQQVYSNEDAVQMLSSAVSDKEMFEFI